MYGDHFEFTEDLVYLKFLAKLNCVGRVAPGDMEDDAIESEWETQLCVRHGRMRTDISFSTALDRAEALRDASVYFWILSQNLEEFSGEDPNKHA